MVSLQSRTWSNTWGDGRSSPWNIRILAQHHDVVTKDGRYFAGEFSQLPMLDKWRRRQWLFRPMGSGRPTVGPTMGDHLISARNALDGAWRRPGNRQTVRPHAHHSFLGVNRVWRRAISTGRRASPGLQDSDVCTLSLGADKQATRQRGFQARAGAAVDLSSRES